MNAMKNRISLPAPDFSRQGNVMEALKNRKTLREFSPGKINMQDLADLVWAACGVNREDGRKTAGSALNRQDCSLYVITDSCAYLYDCKRHELVAVREGDWRDAVAGPQKFAKDATLSLLIVSDYSKIGDPDDSYIQSLCAMDAGIISQNISLFCASAGLATVARAKMDGPALREILGLPPHQHPLLNHPVGYVRI